MVQHQSSILCVRSYKLTCRPPINAEESERDFVAFAAVIRDRAGMSRGSIVVAGPASRFKRYPLGKIAEAVRAACAAAGRALIRRWA